MSRDVAILSFWGELDAFDLGKIAEQVDGVIAAGKKRLICNFRDVEFINSSVLAQLIRTGARLKETEGEMVLSEPSNFLHKAGATLGLDQIFTIFPDDAQALEHFGVGADDVDAPIRVPSG